MSAAGPAAPADRGPADRDWFAAQHATGLLDPRESAEAERLVAADPAFASLVEAWRSRLTELDATAPTIAPSPGLLAAILDRIEADAARPDATAGAPETSASGPAAAMPSDATGAEPHGRVVPFERPRASLRDRWQSVALWRGIAAAASLVAAVVLGAYWLDPKPRPDLVAVLLAEPGRPGAVVEVFADGSVRLVPLQDLPVPAGRALQVWTLRDRAQGPISVGLMQRARTLRLDLGTLPETAPDQLFEITLEPETGSPTGRPTGPILMKGLAARTL